MGKKKIRVFEDNYSRTKEVNCAQYDLMQKVFSSKRPYSAQGFSYY